MRKLPQTIRVFDTVFQCAEVPKLLADRLGCFAWMTADPPQIFVQRGMPPGKEASTVIHEILHAILATFNGVTVPKDDKLREEHFVTMLSTGLAAVIASNPKLKAYLFERL